MLSKFTLRNFKAHRDTTIDMAPLLAFAGPNSAGKTSLLQSIHLLSLMKEHDIDSVLQGNNAFPYLKGTGPDKGFSLKFSSVQERWALTIVVEPNPDYKNYIMLKRDTRLTSPKNSLVQEWEQNRKHREANSFTPLKRELPKEVLRVIPNTTYLQLSTKQLASPSHTTTQSPTIRRDGWGLSSVIAHLKAYDDERFERVQKALQQIVPQVQKLRVRKAKITLTEQRTISLDEKQMTVDDQREIWGDELVFDMLGAKEVPAHAVSEGTLLALGLITAILGPNEAECLLLDDVEHALHPKAQRELIGLFRQLQADNPRLQIMMSTHSPYIVDELEPHEVYVLAMDKEGIAHAKRLDQHPDAERALSVLTTGEFLSAEGEDWVLTSNNESEHDG